MARASSFSADLDKLIFQPVDVDIDADSLKDIYKSDQAYVNKIVENILSQVEQKRTLLEDFRRSSTRRKLRTNIQKLATGTQEFLQEFSGIFDIIKGIDSRAGSIAYGTFSLLLTVAKNKQQHEDVITSTLEDLSRWLSRLRAVEKSEYDNDVILRFVLEIYIKVIDFGRHAVLYYGSSSSKRVFQAVVQPAQSVTQKQAGEIRSLIADLMQELLIIQHDHIKKIKCYLEREQQERDKQCVDKLEILFDVSSDFCAKNMIQESNRMFDGMFSKGKPKAVFSRKAPQLEEISLDALSERSEYKSWMANSSSCLLLLEGENYDSYDTSPRLCWLSPVAVQFYQHFDELKNCYVLYHFIDKSSEVGVVRMLKSIVLQLLRENRDICRKLFDRIQYLSTRPATEQENLFEILHHILRTFNQEKAIYIAVAGVEHMFYNTPRRLFGRLLRLITSADVLVTVKILVICRSRYWPNAGYKDRSGLQRALEIGGHEELLLAVFVAFGWKQRSLSNR